MIDGIYWRFLFALTLVIALIFALAWIAKRLGFAGRIAPSRGRRRLGIQEVMPLDNKRRLVLVKRDGMEHLLLLGLNDDLVVETGIVPPADLPADAAASIETKPSFANLLRGARP